MRKVTVRMTDAQISNVDARVESGVYASRSEAVRDAVRKLSITEQSPIESVSVAVEADDFNAGILDRYLASCVDECDSDVLFCRSRDIAAAFDVQTATVARYIMEHRNESFPRAVSIEKWGGEDSVWEITPVG